MGIGTQKVNSVGRVQPHMVREQSTLCKERRVQLSGDWGSVRFARTSDQGAGKVRSAIEMNKADKSGLFEIVFYVVMFFILLGTGVITLGGIASFVYAVLAFLGLLFVLKMWQDRA
jgi:hypothetical protein